MGTDGGGGGAGHHHNQTGATNGGGSGGGGGSVSGTASHYGTLVGMPKIPDGSKGFPLGYTCGRGRTVKLYKILMSKSPLLSSSDSSGSTNAMSKPIGMGGTNATTRDPSGGRENEHHHGSTTAGAHERRLTAMNENAMPTDAGEAVQDADENKMMDTSTGEDDARDSPATPHGDDDAPSSAITSLDRALDEVKRQKALREAEFTKYQEGKEKLKSGWAAERAEFSRIRDLLRRKNARHHEENARMARNLRQSEDANRVLMDLCRRNGVDVPEFPPFEPQGNDAEIEEPEEPRSRLFEREVLGNDGSDALPTTIEAHAHDIAKAHGVGGDADSRASGLPSVGSGNWPFQATMHASPPHPLPPHQPQSVSEIEALMAQQQQQWNAGQSQQHHSVHLPPYRMDNVESVNAFNLHGQQQQQQQQQQQPVMPMPPQQHVSTPFDVQALFSSGAERQLGGGGGGSVGDVMAMHPPHMKPPAGPTQPPMHMPSAAEIEQRMLMGSMANNGTVGPAHAFNHAIDPYEQARQHQLPPPPPQQQHHRFQSPQHQLQQQMMPMHSPQHSSLQQPAQVFAPMATAGSNLQQSSSSFQLTKHHMRGVGQGVGSGDNVRGIAHSSSSPIFSSSLGHAPAPPPPLPTIATVAMIRDAVPVDRSSLNPLMANGVHHRALGLGVDSGVAHQHLHRSSSSQKAPTSAGHLAGMHGARADDDDCEDIIVWKPK